MMHSAPIMRLTGGTVSIARGEARLTRPVSEGIVVAIGKAVHKTRSQFIGESVLYDSKGREVARGSGLFVRSRIGLTDPIGY